MTNLPAIQSVQLESPLNQYAQVMQIKNAMLSQKQAQREAMDREALTNAYAAAYDPVTGEVDYNKLNQGLISSGGAAQLPAVTKTRNELTQADLSNKKTETELVKERMILSREALAGVTTPEEYENWIVANHSDPVMGKWITSKGATLEQSRAILNKAKAEGTFGNLIRMSQLGIEKAMENQFTSQDLGGSTRVIQTPKYGTAAATVVPGSEANVTKSPNAPVTNVTLNTGKKYGETFATKIAENDVDIMKAAQKSVEAVANADRLLDILEAGNVITGTGANARLQFAKALNLVGTTENETLNNTEQAISLLANSTLANIKASGLGSGQGFTDKDREFLEKAVSGQLTYEKGSLERLAKLSRKSAELTAGKWNERVKTIPGDALEGTGIPTEPIVITPRKSKSTGPKIGTVKQWNGKNYKFTGGDFNNRNNWKIQ